MSDRYVFSDSPQPPDWQGGPPVKQEPMTPQFPVDREGRDCYESAPVLGGLSDRRERQLRIRLIGVLTDAMASDRSASQTVGDILRAMREPLS